MSLEFIILSVSSVCCEGISLANKAAKSLDSTMETKLLIPQSDGVSERHSSDTLTQPGAAAAAAAVEPLKSQ